MKYQELPVDKVELDIENPRIKHYLSIRKELTSEAISLALTGPSDVGGGKYSALKESIKENRGIFTPIIVNHITAKNRYIAIEGNTRLKFYQEFNEQEPNSVWQKIIAIVYDDMSNDSIHAIRLQAHMVGARDWDAFSKAKYLDYLLNTEKKSMNYLKVYCGGQESKILNLINGYQDMMKYYVPKQEEIGEQFDPQKFSYYEELQRNSAKEALAVHGYNISDFTDWVISERIDRAEHVRKLARVLGEEDARKVFLKSTLGEAIKKLDSRDVDLKKIEKTDIYDLIKTLEYKLRTLPYQEAEKLKKDPKYKYNREKLIDLNEQVKSLLKIIGVEEDE